MTVDDGGRGRLTDRGHGGLARHCEQRVVGLGGGRRKRRLACCDDDHGTGQRDKTQPKWSPTIDQQLGLKRQQASTRRRHKNIDDDA